MARFGKQILDEARRIRAPFDYGKIVVSPESLYSSLRPDQLVQVTKCLREWLADCKVDSVLDCTAHIGVDSFNFAAAFGATVTAVEIDPDTYALLRRNVAALKMPITPVLGDIVGVIDTLAGRGERFSFAYLDPPWGGPDYWKVKQLELTLGGLGLDKIIAKLFESGLTDRVIVKLPSNGHIAGAAPARICPIYKPAKPGKTPPRESQPNGRRGAPRHVAYTLNEYVAPSGGGGAPYAASLEQFDKFYKENSDKLMMPQGVNYPMNYQRALAWAGSHCDPESRDFARRIVDYTKYVSFAEFMEHLQLVCEAYVAEAKKDPPAEPAAYVLILPFAVHKSNTWTSLLAYKWLAPILTAVSCDITTVFNDMRQVGSPLYGKSIRCIVCDDCVYTGSQIIGEVSTFDYERVVFNARQKMPSVNDRAWLTWKKQTTAEVDALIKNIDPRQFSVDILAPYMSALASARFALIPYVRVSQLAVVFPVFGQSLDLVGIPAAVQREFRTTFQWHKDISAIYFDHKVADAVSTFNKVYLTAPIFNCSTSGRMLQFIDGCGCGDAPPEPQQQPGKTPPQESPPVDLEAFQVDLEKKMKVCPATFYKSIAYTFGGEPVR
jgi:16S rRNA G966 N2-methylase RsmD